MSMTIQHRRNTFKIDQCPFTSQRLSHEYAIQFWLCVEYAKKKQIYNKNKSATNWRSWSLSRRLSSIFPLLRCKLLCSMLHKTANNEVIWTESLSISLSPSLSSVTLVQRTNSGFVDSTVWLRLCCWMYTKREFFMHAKTSKKTTKTTTTCKMWLCTVYLQLVESRF